jgi:hypothetical protein
MNAVNWAGQKRKFIRTGSQNTGLETKRNICLAHFTPIFGRDAWIMDRLTNKSQGKKIFPFSPTINSFLNQFCAA